MNAGKPRTRTITDAVLEDVREGADKLGELGEHEATALQRAFRNVGVTAEQAAKALRAIRLPLPKLFQHGTTTRR